MNIVVIDDEPLVMQLCQAVHPERAEQGGGQRHWRGGEAAGLTRRRRLTRRYRREPWRDRPGADGTRTALPSASEHASADGGAEESGPDGGRRHAHDLARQPQYPLGEEREVRCRRAPWLPDRLRSIPTARRPGQKPGGEGDSLHAAAPLACMTI